MSVYLDKMNDLLKANTAAADYLKGSSFEYLLSAITFCFLGYFNGREHTTFVMIQGLTSWSGFPCPTSSADCPRPACS